MSDVSCRGWGDIVTALASIISVITTVMSSSQTLKSAPYLVSCHHSSMLWPALMINIWFGIYNFTQDKSVHLSFPHLGQN